MPSREGKLLSCLSKLFFNSINLALFGKFNLSEEIILITLFMIGLNETCLVIWAKIILNFGPLYLESPVGSFGIREINVHSMRRILMK